MGTFQQLRIRELAKNFFFVQIEELVIKNRIMHEDELIEGGEEAAEELDEELEDDDLADFKDEALEEDEAL